MPEEAVVIAAWPRVSSAGTTTYEIILKSNGQLSCNCPGWTFARKGQERNCKHTRELRQAADGVLDLWRQGTPVLALWQPVPKEAAIAAQHAPSGRRRIKYI